VAGTEFPEKRPRTAVGNWDSAWAQSISDLSAVPRRATVAGRRRPLGPLQRRKDWHADPETHPSDATGPARETRVRVGASGHARVLLTTGQVVWDLGQTRTSIDWAAHLKHVDEQLPEMRQYHWVVDNLNTPRLPGCGGRRPSGEQSRERCDSGAGQSRIPRHS